MCAELQGCVVDCEVGEVIEDSTAQTKKQKVLRELAVAEHHSRVDAAMPASPRPPAAPENPALLGATGLSDPEGDPFRDLDMFLDSMEVWDLDIPLGTMED